MEDLQILINAEVHTIYKTGVEVEAMHGASVAALVIYDMLKPIDKGIEITSIKLKNKTGGKSDITVDGKNLKTAVVVCSDTVSKNEKEDKSGKKIIELLQKFNIHKSDYEVIADDIEKIQSALKKYVAERYDLIIFTGGTGLSKRDNTPDAIKPLIEKEIPGITETARNYGQQRTPYSMLSRGVAGFVKDTLVITFPGSVRGVEETMNALFPQVLHVFEVRKNKPH